MDIKVPCRRLICFSFLSLLLLASCTQIPLASEEQRNAASGFRPRHGTAGVYVFCKARVGGSLGANFVYLDSRLLGLCASGTFLYREVGPGRHILSTDLTQFRDTVIDVEPDRVYFIRLTAHGAVSFGSSKPLRLVSQEEGRQEVAKCKQAAANF